MLFSLTGIYCTKIFNELVNNSMCVMKTSYGFAVNIKYLKLATPS